VTDPNSQAARPIVEYTWGKLWNSRAYTACSQMPRAGAKGILTQTQIQHIMALLLDPESPVNKN
jgi:sulfur-oxidizing protein SoxX